MTTKPLDSYSSEELIKMKKLFNIALITVWVGASIATSAVLYRYFSDNVFPSQTIIIAGLAILASFPTYREKKQIALVLAKRTN